MNLYRLLGKRAEEERPVRVGVIGAGKFSAMFLSQALHTRGIHVVGIADLEPEKAREACLRTGWPAERMLFGDSAAAINEGSRGGRTVICPDAGEVIRSDVEVVLEITGVPEAGARHAWEALEQGRHVVMVNVEADALLGPVLNRRAREQGLVYSMAYGDQPALIAEQVDWARACGLEVVCAGKGTRYQPEFHYSTPETVWGHYGFSEEQVATGDYNARMFNSFLDGTKSAIEMCAVSNACELTPQPSGLLFPPVNKGSLHHHLIPKEHGGMLERSGTVEVVASEKRDGRPVHGDLRWGVYVTLRAPSDYVKRCFSEYGVQTDGSGEFTALYRPYHLIGLELGISVASVALRGEPTGASESFRADVGAVAKRDLAPGDVLDGEGGYTVFGKLTTASESLARGYLPLGLAHGAKVLRPVARDRFLTWEDVEVDSTSLAYRLRKEMEAAASHQNQKQL